MSAMATITRTCTFCGETYTMEVDAAAYARYVGGALVQDAFPWMDKDEREQIITGTHGLCWDRMFAEPEEDEEGGRP